MGTLVLWEVSRKQDYIFQSNKLKENKGASIIIEHIIEELPKELGKDYEKNLIYNGGGNSLYKFDGEEQAKKFVKDISERVLRDYPGIQLFMVIKNYNDKEYEVIKAIKDAYKKLEKKKNSRKNSGLQKSFGIEKTCESTGLPAYCSDPDNSKRLISEGVFRKIENSYGDYKDNSKFKRLLPEGVKGIRGFRDLTKEEGEKNYLAVIHIDGNRMGEKMAQLEKCFIYEEKDKSETNKEYLKALRRFSNDIKLAYEDAFKKMTSVINRNKDILDKDTKIKEGFFPVIPVIVAGDDITYVTNGKIGVESARIFLEHLCSNEIEIYGGKTTKLNACAGVAIGKVSHPFYNMYKMAEELCTNGKRKLAYDYFGEDFSLIDWHIEQGDRLGNMSDIRAQYYKTLDNMKLCMRPLYINNDYNDGNAWRNYANFKASYNDIVKGEIYKNKIARNKLKELKGVLRKGKSATRIFLESNNIKNYFGRFENVGAEYCFFDNICIYYDAIEILDLFMELEKEGGKE